MAEKRGRLKEEKDRGIKSERCIGRDDVNDRHEQRIDKLAGQARSQRQSFWKHRFTSRTDYDTERE